MREKAFTVHCYRESLASKEVILGTLQVPREEEKEGREQNAIESLWFGFFKTFICLFLILAVLGFPCSAGFLKLPRAGAPL